ncbi:hypothetical protein FS749_012537 [Ceratobasidium sp. UAMH 11750]|nr:hypothetical protein FS749_012537 [Ceratobasidium sp. UAMH 11750]
MAHENDGRIPENKLELVQVNHTSISNGVTHDQDFYFRDGNLHVLVAKRIFYVHRYKIEEFSVIKDKMEVDDCFDFVELEGDPDDFRRAFSLLYMPLYMPTDPTFEAAVLVSTLRIAIKFGHPFLRDFAIEKFEHLSLAPIDYIPLAREFGLTRWEDAALDKLILRDESLTASEGLVLGNDTLIFVMAQRESRLRQHTWTIPTVRQYTELPLTERTRLKEQFQAVLRLTDSSSDERASTESITYPATPSSPPTTRSRSRFTLADLTASPRSSKRARISGNTTGTMLVQKNGSYRRVERTVRSVLSAK